MTASKRTSGRRWLILVAVGSTMAMLFGANGHLVYVSLASQPDCVPHRRIGENARTYTYSAAESSCSTSLMADMPRSDR